MSQGFDRRLTPARPDLAAKHLEGQIEARGLLGRVVLAGVFDSVDELTAQMDRDVAAAREVLADAAP